MLERCDSPACKHGNDLPADTMWSYALLLARLSIQGITELVCMSQGIQLLRVFAVLVEAEDLSRLLPRFSGTVSTTLMWTVSEYM